MSATGERPDGPASATSGADLLSRLLELLTTSKTMHDLDHHAAGRAFGLNTEDDHRLNHSAQLTDEWHYHVSADPDSVLGPVLQVEFFDSSGVADAAMTDICEVDLDQFGSRLTAAGYTYRKDYGEHDEVIAHEFTRGPLIVTAVCNGEADQPPEKVTHDCIQSVTVR